MHCPLIDSRQDSRYGLVGLKAENVILVQFISGILSKFVFEVNWWMTVGACIDVFYALHNQHIWAVCFTDVAD